MYLVDTNVISEARRGERANNGVQDFFQRTTDERVTVYLSVVTIGELRRGVELIRHRGDREQAERLERWLERVIEGYGECLLPLDEDSARIWGRLRVPRPENSLDKQIAATALLHDLVVVTRNEQHFAPTGVRLLNPFTA